MARFAGQAIEDEGGDEVVLWIGEGDAGLVAGVAKSAAGGVGAELVGSGGIAIDAGIDHEAQAPVDDGIEGFVERVDTMAGGHGFDGLGGEEGGVAVEERLVEAGKFADGAADTAARPGAGEGGGGFGAEIGGGIFFGDLHDGQAVGVLGLLFGGHGDEGAIHAEGIEDVLAEVIAEGLVAQALDDFAQEIPGDVGGVAGGFATGPAGFGASGADSLDHLGPGGVGPAGVCEAEGGGVGEEMAEGDGVFAM